MQKTTIKGGESLSSAISLWNTRHFALDIPEDFTGTSITFQGGGADAPGASGALSGGEDVSIGVLLKG